MHLNPKDAMLLFSSIPTLPLASHKTKITGLNGSVYIDYETDLATYRSWLPQYEMYESLAKEQKESHKAYKAAQRAAAKKAH